MIGNRAQRLIGRSLATAAIVVTLVILVLIYARSGGKGTGAGTLALAPSASRGGAGVGGAGAGNGGSGGAGSSSSGSSGPGSGTGGSGQAAGSGGPPLANGASGSGAGSQGKPAGATGTFTGTVINTLYGPVQVAVSEQEGHIADVKALQLPTEHAQSLFISERVAPLLREEALQAQSAEINIVSGATYTSEGFAQSLQAALSQVH